MTQKIVQNKELGPVLLYVRRFLCVLLMAAIVFGIASVGAIGEEAPIRVGCVENYGFQIDSLTGDISGYIYDYLTEIAKYTGWKYEFVQCEWNEALDMLANGQIDLLGGLQITPERKKLYSYNDRAIGYEYGALYLDINRPNAYYGDLSFLDGLRVGVEKGVYFNDEMEAYCRSNQISVEYVYTDMSDFRRGLDEGRFDAVLCGSILDIPDTTVVAKINSQPYYFCTTRGNGRILAELNEAIDRILTQDAYFSLRLDQKYYGDKPINQPAFTKQEAAYLEEHPILNVACDPNWAPIEYWDTGSDSYKGIMIGILQLIGEEMGVDLVPIQTDNYEDSKRLVQTGVAQLLTGSTELALETGITRSNQILEVPIILVCRKSSGTIDLKQKNGDGVAVIELNSETTKKIRAQYPNLDYHAYGSSTSCLEALSNGTESFAFLNSYAFDELARTGSLADYVTISTEINFPLNIGISPQADPILLGIINKSIQRISLDKLNSLVFSNTVNRSYQVPLSRVIKERSPLIITLVVLVFLMIVCVIIISNLHIQAKLRRAAYVDELTGLSSLNKFELDATAALKSAAPNEFMLVCMDVDHFKYINDAFGYDFGNRLLVLISSHFERNHIIGELIARIGADNFVFFAKSLEIDQLMERFRLMSDVQGELNTILPEHYNLTFSAGVYIINQPDASLNSMIDRANIARKSVKGSHMHSIGVYTDDMDRNVEWKRRVTLSMENALLDEEFELYLQPKYRFSDECIVGAEALVRWNHPEYGMILPSRFIPIFEQNGFIRKLDLYMFEHVCALLRFWTDKTGGTVPLVISVNLSKVHLNNPRLTEDLLSITQRYRVPPEYIELELTESCSFSNAAALISTASSFQAVGFHVSIDDFGSGYSSLNLLKDLPINVLKFDKGFLDDTSCEKKGLVVISKMIELAKELNLTTVVEGIETREQADLLRQMGCDIAQGFYFAKPMPTAEVSKLLNL